MSASSLKRLFFGKKSSPGPSARNPQSTDSPAQSPKLSGAASSLENGAAAGRSSVQASPLGTRGPAASTITEQQHLEATHIHNLIQAEQKLERETALTMAPRRARSADRLDGKRVTPINTPAAAFLALQQKSRDQLMAQFQYSRSPQPVRSDNYPVVAQRVMQTPAASANASTGTSSRVGQSPPPPYTLFYQRSRGPPSYHQAMAAMTMATAARAQRVTDAQQRSEAYYMALAKAREARGLPPACMRKFPTAFPAFTDDVICTCHNCRLEHREQGSRDYNADAVYMEPQPFLTDEIMSNGMELCPIS